MNLGDVMRELGLDMFASSSASSSQRGEGGDGPDAFDDVEGPDGPAGPGIDDPGAGGGFEDEFDDSLEAEDTDDDDDDLAEDRIMDRLDDISYEIDQLSADIEDNSSSIKALRSERDEVIERLERIDQNNATLLGVYDRLTNEINPFAGDWNEKYDEKVSEQDGQAYGVIQPPDNEAEARAAAREMEEEDDEAEGLSFDDLKNKHDEDDETNDEDEEEVVTHAEPEAEPEPQPVEQAPPSPEALGAGDEPYLTQLGSTFSTEVLLMEWLSMLIDIAGPAGAMKALDFYERINWISPHIKRQCEDILSGAHEARDVPSRPPSDLTAEEHNRSFAHIMRLAQQRQFAESRGA
jgi:archaellum component FlaD/FlaE